MFDHISYFIAHKVFLCIYRHDFMKPCPIWVVGHKARFHSDCKSHFFLIHNVNCVSSIPISLKKLSWNIISLFEYICLKNFFIAQVAIYTRRENWSIQTWLFGSMPKMKMETYLAPFCGPTSRGRWSLEGQSLSLYTRFLFSIFSF